jgi:hypothetical protein
MVFAGRRWVPVRGAFAWPLDDAYAGVDETLDDVVAETSVFGMGEFLPTNRPS